MKHKLFILIPLMLLTGCQKRSEHKNIVQDINTGEDTTTVLLKDAITGIERIYEIKTQHAYNIPLFKPNDTVTISAGYLIRDDYYDECRILKSDYFALKYNRDSIYARQKRKRFARELENFDRKKREMLQKQSGITR